MFENYVDIVGAFSILYVHPETVDRPMQEGRLDATKVDRLILELRFLMYDSSQASLMTFSL